MQKTEITTSEIRTYMSCQRKWKHSYLDLRVTPKVDAAPTTGSAVHEGLDLFWQGHALKDAIMASDKYLSKTEFHNQEVFVAKARAMLIGYYKKYKEKREDYEVIRVETNLTPTEIIPGVFMRGKVDKLFKNKKTGRHLIRDHKTTSLDFTTPNSHYQKKLNFDLQSIIYKWAVEKELGEEVDMEFDCIFREGTKGPKYKKTVKKRKAETEEEFAVRQVDNKETIPEYGNRIAETYLEHLPDWYKIFPIYHTKDFMAEKVIEIQTTARAMQKSIEDGVFPCNDGSCFQYFKPCAYFEVCCGLTEIDSDHYVDKEHKHVELDSDEEEAENVLPF